MKKTALLLVAFILTLCGSASATRFVEFGKNLPAPIADFSDDFSDMSAWSVEKENGANWHIDELEGNRYLTSGPVDTWGADRETIITANSVPETLDFVFKADVSDKRYGAMASLVFKYKSPEYFYSLRMLNIENVDYIGFYRRNGVTLWEEENLTLVKFPNGIREPERTYEIKVKIENNKFTAYVDGVEVTEYVEDKDYFNGNKVGIFQSYGEPSYDNFEIYSSHAFDGADSEFSYNSKLLLDLGLLEKPIPLKNSGAPVTVKDIDTFMYNLCSLPETGVDGEYATFEYVVNCFVKALGYDKIPDTPDFYTARKKLLQNLDDTADNITWDGFVKMAVNSFDIEMITPSYGTKNSYKKNNQTLLSMYHNIYSDTAILSDNGITDFDGTSKLKNGWVGFDNDFYALSNNTNAEKYIGYNVKYYYIDDNEPKLLNIRLEPDNEVFLYSDEIISFNNDVLCYKARNTDKILKKKLSKNVKCIYNGKATSRITVDMLNLYSGDVTIIENGSEQVVIIHSYTDTVVERVDVDGEKIFDKLTNNGISWKNTINVCAMDSNCNEIPLSDISDDDVVSIAKSTDGKSFEILVSKNKIQGTVREVDEEGGNAVINGKRYVLTKNFFRNSFITSGDIGTLYLNSDGNGVYFKHSTESPCIPAYMIKVSQSDSLDSRVRVQLFDGKLKVYPCASTMKINDTVYRQNLSYNVLSAYQDIFEYKLNSKGEISYIGFPESSYDNYNGGGITENGRFMGGTFYKSATRSFSGFLLADKDVKVFLVPLDRTRTDAYALTDISYFKDDVMYYSLVGYAHGGNKETAEIIVSEFDTYPQYQLNTLCIVENVTSVLTDDGRDGILLTVRYDANDVKNIVLNEECSLENITIGDVIQYSENFKGEVHSILPVFDLSNEEVKQYGNTYYTASCRVIYGTVGEIRKNSFIFNRASGGNEIVTLTCPVLIYDSQMRGAKIYQAKNSDIKDVVGYGVDADKMLIRFEYGIPRQMIIYR